MGWTATTLVQGTRSAAPAQQKGAARPFGLRDKLGYAFGDAGNDFTFVLVGAFFMLFATNYVGVSPIVVGMIFLVVRLVDAFFDVSMGRLIDLLPAARDGKFRPWLRRMALIVPLLGALCFLPAVHEWPMGMRIGWLTALYFLYSIAYSAINIPYGSMASAISDKPAHRSSLSVFRSVGANVAVLVIMSVLPLVVYTKDASGAQVLDPWRMFAAVVVCGALAAGFYFLSYVNVSERVVIAPKPKEQRPSPAAVVRSLVANRGLMSLIVAALVLLVAIGIGQGVTAYLWLDYFGNGSLMALASLATYLPVFLIAPFVTRLGLRFGKKELAVVGLLLATAVLAVLYFTHSHNPWVYIAASLVAGVCLGVFNMLIWAFITDVIDSQEVRTGQRDDGTVYATYSWARKVGQAVSGGLAGAVLTFIGYKVSTGAHVQQAPATLDGLFAFSTIVPAALYLVIALVLHFWYPLNRRTVEANAAELAGRHELVEAA